MKAIFYLKVFTCLVCFAAWRTIHADEVKIMVMADRVNLRNDATLDSDVIGQVNYGDELTVLEIGEAWVRVRPPAAIPVWVHAGLLFEEREVRARVLNVRSGPGTQFSSLGMLNRGDTVEVLERFEEWVRISAPDAVFLYVSKEFVNIPSPAVAAVEEQETEVAAGEEVASSDEAPPVVEEVVVAAVVPEIVEVPSVSTPVEESVEEGVEGAVALAPLEEEHPVEMPAPEEEAVLVPDVPENVALVPLPGQGTASVRRGWVKVYLLAGSSPSRFHLIHRQGSQEQTLCYLQGDEEYLRNLAGRQVQVRGRDFWVAGQRVPLTRIDSIEALENRGE